MKGTQRAHADGRRVKGTTGFLVRIGCVRTLFGNGSAGPEGIRVKRAVQE